MRKLLLAATLIATGCESSHTSTAPTAFQTKSGPSVSAAASVPAQQTSFSFCPEVTPFASTIGVVVVAGNVNVVVTSITTQFTDSNHVQLPMITLPAPIPIAQFGSDLVQARSGVTFPVTVNFGCGTTSTGTVALTVHLQDANGVSTVHNLSVGVR